MLWCESVIFDSNINWGIYRNWRPISFLRLSLKLYTFEVDNIELKFKITDRPPFDLPSTENKITFMKYLLHGEQIFDKFPFEIRSRF